MDEKPGSLWQLIGETNFVAEVTLPRLLPGCWKARKETVATLSTVEVVQGRPTYNQPQYG
jgi:hypothetical protein